MKELDLSAGGFPERTYVGKNTTVADVMEYIAAMRAQHKKELIEALEHHDDLAEPGRHAKWSCVVCDEIKDLRAELDGGQHETD